MGDPIDFIETRELKVKTNFNLRYWFITGKLMELYIYLLA